MTTRTMSQISLMNYLNVVKPNLTKREESAAKLYEQLQIADARLDQIVEDEVRRNGEP